MNAPQSVPSEVVPVIGRRRMLVYGNCQAGWLAQALQRNVRIAAEYEIVYLSDYAVIPADHPIHQPDFLATRTDVIWQTASGCQPPAFLEGLTAECRQIRFPTLWLKLLWPTYAVDPRNQPEPDFPWGRYPYGDRLVMKLLQDGVSIEDLPKRYRETDLNRIINLDRFTEMSLTEMKFNDRQSDVMIATFIEVNFRKRRLFGTVNHPTHLVLNEIYEGVCAAVLGEERVLVSAEPADGADVLGEEETPLHPQIISHFGLSWATPEMKWRYRSAFLSLDDYIRAYGTFTAIPCGDPPALWLDRANQAYRLNDFKEAKRLLLKAAVRYPNIAHFLHYLGVLLIRHGKYVEAEKVVRYALGQHPSVAGLYHILGVTLARRNFKAEALKMYREALCLDPDHVDARRDIQACSGPSLRTFPVQVRSGWR